MEPSAEALKMMEEARDTLELVFRCAAASSPRRGELLIYFGTKKFIK